VMVDDMTHLLRKDECPASIMGSARLLGQPVASELIEKAAQWILAKTAANNQLQATSKTGA